MHNELIKLRASKTETFANLQVEELKNLKEKVIFFQDENLRLSHDLSNSQKKYEIMKDKLNDIEKEKSNISKKIEDLTDSLSNTKILTKVFEEKSNINKAKNPKEAEKIDIDKEIKKIFS